MSIGTYISFLVKYISVGALIITTATAFGQVPTRTIRPGGGLPQIRQLNQNNPNDTGRNTGARADSIPFQHRDDAADSITINYIQFDSLNFHSLDTTLNDKSYFYSLPSNYVSMGTNGNAAYPVLYQPQTQPGFDPGFHAFDVYKFTLANTKFYQTTRPYTVLGYFQGTGAEQLIKIFHTQNIRPNWNAGFNIRIITNPGVFQNQNNKHNNYRFFSSYQGRRKRYGAELVFLANNLASSENGGITDPVLLGDPTRKRRIAIPVHLGNNSGASNPFFSSALYAGNRYHDMDFFLRQRYDIGKKDSVAINDSTMEYLFYPKLRFQHEFRYQKSFYQFIDNLANGSRINFATTQGDSAFFDNSYDVIINPRGVDFSYMDEWQYMSNDFSLKQFPETKNQRQFLQAGIRLENYTGAFTHPFIPDNILVVAPGLPVERKYYNGILRGEYRNKTRNRLWDVALRGEFYLAGFYAGDYSATANLQRFINQKWGTVNAFFLNTSRSPSFIFQSNSAFNIDTATSLTKRENITILGVHASNKRFDLLVRNISIANYAYFTDYYKKNQSSALINITQGVLSLKTKLNKHFNLYSDFIVQQSTADPVRLPLFYTRQRLALEGLFFKNLNLSTGLDIRYNTPYKMDNYSPILGQFFPQDDISISNRPNVDFFFNFRIKKITTFISFENLNTISLENGFGFTHNNFAAPLYPTPGLIFRFGIKWEMIN